MTGFRLDTAPCMNAPQPAIPFNRSRFFRGQVDKYSWVDLGSSYVISDVLAAFLYAQLAAWKTIQDRRRELWQRFHAALANWASLSGIQQPVVPPHCDSAWHMHHLLLPSAANRSRFIEHLKTHKILAVFHYLPLHLSSCRSRFGGQPGDCPVTEDISDRLIRLPFFNSMSNSVQDQVIDAVLNFRCS